ncbi:MAG TPA: ABC transporter permease [Ferruginibacter sp.]|nr:ABC transporter permease [Ferruginibacter sp.]HMP21836.1 ABC transporter permease [Ferruginibacter sp.]
MIKNLFIIAFRNLTKDKWYSLLNVLGLAIGICFSLFLIFYVTDELSYDKHHSKADRIYRIDAYIQEPEKNMQWAFTQYPLGPTIKKDFPEVEESVRFVRKERTLFKQGNVNYFETGIYFADSTVFNIFSHKFKEGNATHALDAPNSIVITQTLARKYFGANTPYAGKVLQTANNENYTVTGVIEDVPANSHILFDMLISTSTLPRNFQDNWGGFNNYTYVLLKPGTDVKAFNKKMLPMYDKYMAPIFAQYNIRMHYTLQPITAIHLHSTVQGEPGELGSMSYIWIFSAVAFFMLLIACINYMNLTTARSARRAKEIGIRKVNGSSRRQLVTQFLTESLLTAFVAMLLSVILLLLLMPYFNTMSGKNFTAGILLQPYGIMLLLGVVLFTGLAGGSYPAFYLSSFNPVGILKGALSKASGNVNLRRTLVVLQFAISMIMLICTWVVYAQLSYLRNKDLGFDKTQVMTVTVNTGNDERSKIYAMNNEFRSLESIQSVGTGYSYPGSRSGNLNLFSVETKNGNIEKGIECYSVDEHYIPTLNMKMMKGRNFSGMQDTLHSIVVNEAMVKDFGWEEPLGKRIKYPGDTSGTYFEVIGVVKDFNQKALYNPIVPLILFYNYNCNIIQLKLAGENTAKSIAAVEQIWKKFFPELPFEYTFLDQDYNSQYVADQKRGRIFAIFSVLTIIITCLGLLGLTAFTTQQKQKEISVRRVLGASTSSVVVLITKNYLWLALIAAAIAFPVAWYFMNNWLKVFTYSAGLSAFPFVLSAVVILCTAVITATFHAAKAAWAKPAKVLRTE